MRDIEHGALLRANLAQHPRRQQAQRAADGGQRGPQFVAHRGHELVLEPLDAPTFADVGHHRDHPNLYALSVPHLVEAHQHRNFVASSAQHRGFSLKGFTAVKGLAHPGNDFGRNQALALFTAPPELLEREAKIAPRRRVEVDDLAARVADRDAVRRGFHRLLDKGEPLGVALEGGDIGTDTQHLHTAVLAVQRRFDRGVDEYLAVQAGEGLLEGHGLAPGQHGAVILEPLRELGNVVGVPGTDSGPEIVGVLAVSLVHHGVDQHQLPLGIAHEDRVG